MPSSFNPFILEYPKPILLWEIPTPYDEEVLNYLNDWTWVLIS